MAITNGYATLAEYKNWIAVRGLSGDVALDVQDDSVIEILIEAASRYIDRETGKRFFKDTSDQTRYYTTDDAYCVRVDPLAEAPTSVSVDYTEGLRSYTVLSSSTDYDLLPDNAALEGMPYTEIAINTAYSSYFPKSRRGIKVVGKFGYPAVPKDVKDATLMIAQNINSARSGQSSNGRITVTAGGVVIRPEEVPALAQKVIEHYRTYV